MPLKITKSSGSSKKQLTNFQKQLISYLAINLCLVGGFLFSYIYFSKQISENTKLAYEKLQKDINTNLLTEYISKLEKDNKYVIEEFGPYLDLLPLKDNLINFKEDLIKLATKYKLDPAFSFGIENPATEKELNSYTFTLIISGTESDLVNFLKEVAKMKYIIQFSQIMVEKENAPEINLLEAASAPESITTTTKKVSKTVKTTLMSRYKMNISGKIYIRQVVDYNESEIKN